MKTPSVRIQILCFLLLTFTFSWFQVYLISQNPDGIENPLRAFALMWTPGLVGLLLSWLFGHRLRDIGFKKGPWRFYLWSYLVPALTAILILLTLILTGLGEFEIQARLIEKYGDVGRVLLQVLGLGTTLMAIPSFVSGLGEEIGWRGFLHSKLIDSKISHPYLVTGLIWALWHWPLILFSNYGDADHRLYGLTMFSLMAISASVFMGWVRSLSGSVFTAALFHGIHNLWIQGIYPAFLNKGPMDVFFGGEFGALNAFFYAVLAIWIYRNFLVRGRVPEFEPGAYHDPCAH